ncbi:MAG: HEAT repeat domain-containing protein, partial [Candidatus Odinarchaeota archaeon]
MSNDLTSFMVYVVVFLSIMIYEGGKRFKSFFSRGEITLSKSLILDRKRKTTAMDSSVRTESVEQNQVLCVSCGKEIENPNTGDFPVCLTCSSEKTSERVKEKKRVHVYYMKNKGKKGIVEVLSLLRIDNPETSSSLTLEDFRSNYTLVPLVLDVVDLDHLNRMLSITDNKNKSLETRKNLSIGDIVFVPVDEKLYIRHIMGWKQLAVSFTDELAFETVLTTNNKTGNEIKLILTGLLHDKEEVRLNSVRMVGSIAKKTGTNKLLSELKRNKDVVVILIETLGDQSKNVSLEAIETLGLLSVAGVDVLDPFITFIVISWESLNEEVLEKSLRLLIELAPSSDQITALENLLPEIMSKSSADTARVITELMTLMLDNVRIVNCQKCGTKCPEFIHDEQQLCFGCLKEIEEKKIKTVGSTETKRVHVYYQKSDGDPTQITQKLEENENNFYSHIFALDENTTTDTDISSEYFNQFYVKLPICLDVISLDQVFMIMNGLTKTPPPMISKKNIEWLKNNGVSHIHLQPGDIVFQVETAQCFMYSYGSWIDLSLVLLDELDGSTEVPSTEVPETSNGSEYQNEKKITGDLPANNLNRETSFEDIIEKIEEYSASDLAATDSDIDFEIELAKSKLKDSKKEVRLQALNDLGEINDLRITRLLFNSLDDVDHTVRETAARIFSKVTRPILNVVINGHYRSELKETAKHLLEKYEPFISDQPDDLEIDGEKLQVLTRKFKTGNSNTRLDVLSSVTEINSVEIYGLIFVALNDPSLLVVFRALRTLEYLNDKRPDDRTVIIEALLTFVTDKSSNMNDTVLAKLIETVTKITDSVEAQESIKTHPKLESLLDVLNTLSEQSKADRIKTSA